MDRVLFYFRHQRQSNTPMTVAAAAVPQLLRQAVQLLALPAADAGAQCRHRGRAAAAARIPQFGHHGRHHEHDRRRAGLCALDDRARLPEKT